MPCDLQQTAPKIFGGPIKTHLLVFTDADESAEELAGVKEVAKEVKGKLLAVTVASSNDRVLNYFGIEKSTCRAFLRRHWFGGLPRPTSSHWSCTRYALACGRAKGSPRLVS